MTDTAPPTTEPPAPPLISVIVPIFDVRDHVGACIASLRAQNLGDFEAIIVDDGSRDDSLERAREAIGGDPRFRIVQQENRGLSGARNTGLGLARGTFIAFLDSDDRAHPDWLQAMHAALEDTGADLAACAIRLVWPDGQDSVHSAIHGAPALPAGRGPVCVDMTDWRVVIRHFPSAWNKLYRRTSIEGLRFDEGTWFEDHAFYWQVARRCRRMIHLDQALYLHSRDRPGQITGQDSDRVFEQIGVLNRLAELLPPADEVRGGRVALARLASRLVFERAQVLRDADRRLRFAAAAAAFFERQGLTFAPDWDPQIDRGWGQVMAGRVPLSVVIPSNGDPGPLEETLKALQAQAMPWLELLVVCDDTTAAEALKPVQGRFPEVRPDIQSGRGSGPARNHGLATARGTFIVFMDAGDRPYPGAFTALGNALDRHDADAGLAAFRVGIGGDVHSGLHDSTTTEPRPDGITVLPPSPGLAMRVHAHPSAWIFRRALLLEQDIAFGETLRPDWQVALAATLRARRIVRFGMPWLEVSEAPEARKLWHQPLGARALATALDRLCDSLTETERQALPQGWRRRLFARAGWEQLTCAPRNRAARLGFALGFALACRRRGLHRDSGAVDGYVGTRLLTLLGLKPHGASPRVASPEASPHNSRH